MFKKLYLTFISLLLFVASIAAGNPPPAYHGDGAGLTNIGPASVTGGVLTNNYLGNATFKGNLTVTNASLNIQDFNGNFWGMDSNGNASVNILNVADNAYFNGTITAGNFGLTLEGDLFADSLNLSSDNVSINDEGVNFNSVPVEINGADLTVMNGIFSGDGGGITNLQAGDITGTIPTNNINTNLATWIRHISARPAVTGNIGGSSPIFTGGSIILHEGTDFGGHCTITNGGSTSTVTTGMVLCNVIPATPFSTNATMWVNQTWMGQYGETSTTKNFANNLMVSNNVSSAGAITNFQILCDGIAAFGSGLVVGLNFGVNGQ